MKRETRALLAPQFWPAWLVMGFLWLLSKLPCKWQLAIGKNCGKLVYYCAPKLRKTTQINIDLCFPNLSTAERQILIKRNMEALGMGMMETAMAWWLSDKRLKKCDIQVKGVEYAEQAFAKGKGIILLSPHFLCLEMIGRLIGTRYSVAAMYRPHKKSLIDFMQKRFRKKYRLQHIAKHRIRELLKVLQQNTAVWYAYDIDAGEKRSVFAPFFGIQTASLTAVSRIAKMSGASVVPIAYRRTDPWGYEISLSPPLENFPTDDWTADATRLNAILEKAIRNAPEQYIWQYKRFKTRPIGEERFY